MRLSWRSSSLLTFSKLQCSARSSSAHQSRRASFRWDGEVDGLTEMPGSPVTDEESLLPDREPSRPQKVTDLRKSSQIRLSDGDSGDEDDDQGDVFGEVESEQQRLVRSFVDLSSMFVLNLPIMQRDCHRRLRHGLRTVGSPSASFPTSNISIDTKNKATWNQRGTA